MILCDVHLNQININLLTLLLWYYDLCYCLQYRVLKVLVCSPRRNTQVSRCSCQKRYYKIVENTQLHNRTAFNWMINNTLGKGETSIINFNAHQNSAVQYQISLHHRSRHWLWSIHWCSKCHQRGPYWPPPGSTRDQPWWSRRWISWCQQIWQQYHYVEEVRPSQRGS